MCLYALRGFTRPSYISGGGGGREGWAEGGEGPPPSKLPFWGLAKNQICNLVFRISLPKMGFLAFCQAPSKLPKSQFGKEVGAQKFRIKFSFLAFGGVGSGGEKRGSHPSNPLSSSKLDFWPFEGFGQTRAKIPKVKFVQFNESAKKVKTKNKSLKSNRRGRKGARGG